MYNEEQIEQVNHIMYKINELNRLIHLDENTVRFAKIEGDKALYRIEKKSIKVEKKQIKKLKKELKKLV